MAKSNGCLWVVEWAKPRNGSGAAKPLTWRFSAAYDRKREADGHMTECAGRIPSFISDAICYRVVKYVPAGKP